MTMSVCPNSCLSYVACKSRFGCAVLRCHLCDPVRLHHIFPHYLINGTIFGAGRGRGYPTQKNVYFDFPYNSSLKHFILTRFQRDIITNLQGVFMFYSCQIFMILEFSQQISKNPQYQISRKHVQWQLCCSIRTDRWKAGHTWWVFVAALRNSAKVPKKSVICRSWIRASWHNYEFNQRDATI
jgi:hypothetical protein